MKYNMNIIDAALRYFIMHVFVIIGGLTGHLWIMLLGLPFFLAGMLGACPIFNMLGIQHDWPKEDYMVARKKKPENTTKKTPLPKAA